MLRAWLCVQCGTWDSVTNPAPPPNATSAQIKLCSMYSWHVSVNIHVTNVCARHAHLPHMYAESRFLHTVCNLDWTCLVQWDEAGHCLPPMRQKNAFIICGWGNNGGAKKDVKDNPITAFSFSPSHFLLSPHRLGILRTTSIPHHLNICSQKNSNWQLFLDRMCVTLLFQAIGFSNFSCCLPYQHIRALGLIGTCFILGYYGLFAQGQVVGWPTLEQKQPPPTPKQPLGRITEQCLEGSRVNAF